MQCACAILLSVAYLAVKIFSLHYLINGTNFEKKNVIEYKMCSFFIFPLKILSQTFLFLIRNERVMIKNVQSEHKVFP